MSVEQTHDPDVDTKQKIQKARDLTNQMTRAGVSETEEKELQTWLDRVDDMNSAVKYLLSDDYKPDEDTTATTTAPTPPTPEPTPAAPSQPEPTESYHKQRYTSDYSRFDRPDFVEEVKKAKKEKTPKAVPTDVLPPKPDRNDTKALTDYLMKKESLSYKEQGNTAIKAQQYTLAEEHYSSGIALDPICYVLRNNRAQARLKLCDWKGTVQDCDFVLSEQNDPLNIKAIKRRAVALMKLHNSEAALRDIRKAQHHEGSTKELRLLTKEAEAELQYEEQVRSYKQEDLDEITAQVTKIGVAMQASKLSGPAIDGEGRCADLTNTLLEMRATLQRSEADAVRIHFLWSGGADMLLGYVEEFRVAICNSLKERTLDSFQRDWDVLCTSLFLVLAEVFSTEYTITSMLNQRKEVPFKVLLTVLVDAFMAPKACCFSALKLLVNLTENSRLRIVLTDILSVDTIMSIPHHTEEGKGGDGTLALLLQLIDNLLKSSEWGDALAAAPLPHYILPLMSSARSRGVRDAAAGAAMRLTTDTRFRETLTTSNLPLPSEGWSALGANMATRSQNALQYLSGYLTAEGASLESPFAVEAILASLQNCLLDSSERRRKESLATIATPITVEACIALLNRNDKEKNISNLHGRALGLLSKCISIPEVHGLLKQHNCVNLLLQFADREEESFGLREGAVSILAALVSKEAQLLDEKSDDSMMCEVNEHTEHIFSGERTTAIMRDCAKTIPTLKRCLGGADRLCGNAALILSELSKDATWIVRFNKDVKGGMVGPLLSVIRQKRAEQYEEENHQKILRQDAVATTPLDFTLNIQAQKNAAIALARLAKDPSNLVQLREQQGIEILATTMKYVNEKKPTRGLQTVHTDPNEGALAKVP